MSNFLLRMVARTAGLGPASGLRPRTEIQQFLPPAPALARAYQPQPDAATRLNAEVVPQPAVPADDTATTLRQPASDQSIPPQPPAFPGVKRSIDRVAPVLTSERFDARKTEATPETVKQPTPAMNQQMSDFLSQERPQAPENPEAAPEIAQGPVVVAKDTVQEVHTLHPVRIVARPVRLAEATPAKPASDVVESREGPRTEEDTHSIQPSLAEAALRPQRPSQPRPAPGVAGQQEPPVEVKIGRVEVHMEAAPAPPAPARPQGFAEYSALRRYQARPWDFRNR